MKTLGMLSIEELNTKTSSQEIETVILAFTDHYGRLMGKRFDAEYFLENGTKEGTHACDYLLTTDMEMEPVPGYDFASWELGYGDFHLVPDLQSLRIADWLETTALVICDIKDDKSNSLIEEAPRSILKRQLGKAEELGYTINSASELEYYLFENDYRSAHESGYADLTPAGWYLEDYHILQGSRTEEFTSAARRHLKNSGIPVESSKGEWGKGQHELNIRYTDVFNMADRHIIYKQCLKELADRMGLSVTFMAKLDSAKAGSSCHLHMSLWKDNINVFPGDQKNTSRNVSNIFKWFLGGWIKYAPDVMPFYAPTINSYKRFVDGSWAPTRLAWSYDNRTAGFRVVGSGPSLRIECRIPGADCNPYLAYAALLASGLRGIEDQIEPPENFEGDIYAASNLPRVPYTLEEALDNFENSSFVKDAFGEKVMKHYSHFFKSEINSFNQFVTDWERKRYFERI